MQKTPYFTFKPMPKKAALRASPAIDEPNVIIPLASSYNERGITGYTHAVTNSEDQRKVNCFYELSKNATTGKGTLTLAKRPGVTIDANSYGSSTQDTYLISTQPAGNTAGKSGGDVFAWVFSTIPNGSNRDIRVSNSGTTTTILSNTASNLPCFVDKTIISGAETVVLQTRRNVMNDNHRVWFSSTIATWTEIVDADFTGLVHRGKIEHMDGFAFVLESQNRIFNSDSNSLANWTATSFLTKQIVQDAPVGLAKLNNQILAFGDDTVEMFYNAGNTTGSPLLPLRHLHQRIGLIVPPPTVVGAGHYSCVIDNTLFFIGRDSGGIKSAGAFAYNGQIFEKISSPYIDKILSQITNISFYSLNSVGFFGQQAVAISLTLPVATSQMWLMFFPKWKEWFEWTSTVFSPINSGEFFLPCGTGLKNKIYNFPSIDNWQDDGTSYQWFSQFKLPTNGSSRRFMPMYGVDADTDTSANNLTVEISIDDSKTFSTLGTIDQTQDRKVLFRGGSFRKAHIRLGNTNARPTRIHNFLARID